MSTAALILAAILKIAFVLAVVVGVFAPLLVWAERRQSAMIQDRVGPSRAGIPLPDGVREFLRSTVGPMQNLAILAKLGVAACIGSYLLLALMDDHTLFGFSGEFFIICGVLSVVGAGALKFGSRLHAAWAKQGSITLLGTLHSAADALKMMWKEDFMPPKADGFLFALAPIITVIPAIASFAVIPFADVLHLEMWNQVMPETGTVAGPAVDMQIASLNVGILFIFAIAGTGIIGAAIGGYASDNKYSLMGGIRAASQMVSYEVALGLTIVPCFMLYGSLRLEEMALYQYENYWGIFHPALWLPFILYFTSAIAETKRVPFDAPEGESELVGGYLTEYSGMKFGMFFTGEFVEVVALSAIATILFFGGWDVPWLYRSGFDLPGTWEFTVPFTEWVIGDKILLMHWGVVAIQVLAFIIKIVGFIFLQLTIRWTLPRFRYDQIMQLCWKGILPLSLLNILIMGVVILLTQ